MTCTFPSISHRFTALSIWFNPLFRDLKDKYLPVHARGPISWTWFPWIYGGKCTAEYQILDHFKRVPSNYNERRCIRKYLEFCWSLPYYGYVLTVLLLISFYFGSSLLVINSLFFSCFRSAFFQGQIEQPVRGLTSLITHQDIPVHIAINSQGVHVIDIVKCVSIICRALRMYFKRLSKPFVDFRKSFLNLPS